MQVIHRYTCAHLYWRYRYQFWKLKTYGYRYRLSVNIPMLILNQPRMSNQCEHSIGTHRYIHRKTHQNL
jgi:hypothetical protein